MEKYKLDEMTKGWFVGGFQPTVFQTQDCEVSVKRYSKGDYEPPHFHKIATEITVIVSGRVRMCGREFQENDIIVLKPGEITEFEVLEDSITTVVKIPGALNDKYLPSETP
jgi:hypothetical protein